MDGWMEEEKMEDWISLVMVKVESADSSFQSRIVMIPNASLMKLHSASGRMRDLPFFSFFSPFVRKNKASPWKTNAATCVFVRVCLFVHVYEWEK